MWSAVDSVGPGQQPAENNSPAVAIFFLIYIIVGSFFVINLFVGAVIDHYHEVKNRTEGNPMLTDAQRQWVSTRRKMMSARLGLHHGIAIEPRSLGTVRRVCYTIVSNPYFEGFIYSEIGLNTLLLASKVRGSAGPSLVNN